MPGRNVLFTLVVVAAGVAGIWTFGPPAAAQVGGGGPGTGDGSDGIWRSRGGETLLQGGGSHPSGGATAPTYFILVSPDNMRAWGHSAEQGEWKPAPVEGDVGNKLVPVLGTMVATIQEGRKIHAFSSLKGEWDTLDLSEDLNEFQPVVGQDYAQVRTASAVSVFSARTGRWGTVKFAEE